MIIRVKKPSDLPYSAVTPESIYRSRREFIQTAALGSVGLASLAACASADAQTQLPVLPATRNAKYVAADTVNTYEDITSYNNFYEFGTEKDEPARNAYRLKTSPWKVKVDGLVAKPGDYNVDDLVDFKALEERIYRHRCVEAWSMVMPFIGVPLSSVLNKVQPQPSARFVEFTTLLRPTEMIGQRSTVLDWPYVEGLRMDEAMHPLSLMVVGLYGRVLPNQTGAPLRIHVPWKYGFKHGKSIVRIRFMDAMPRTSWPISASNEYGFYANVNPTVHHPRWKQDYERRLPSYRASTPTLMFNGYGDEVASLYNGMDLRRNF